MVVGADKGVLSDDDEYEGLVEAAIDTYPTFGSITLELDGSFTYTPPVLYSDVDVFTYLATDENGNSSTATITISHGETEVNGVMSSSNDNPVYAKVGDVITVSFETNEEIIFDGATIAGQAASYNPIDSTHFTIDYTMQESDEEGAISFSLDYRDVADEPRNTSLESEIIFDKTPPVIDLGGSDQIEIEIDAGFTETATVSDSVDETVELEINGIVNDGQVGTYALTYSATDAAGNAADQITRVVTVYFPIDSTTYNNNLTSDLLALGLQNNLSEVNDENIGQFSGLYFEKSVDDKKIGRITFEQPIDLNDYDTYAFLSEFNQRMRVGPYGFIALDFLDSPLSLQLRNIGANIKFYNLDKIGFDDNHSANDVYQKLLVYDENGNNVDRQLMSSGPGIYVGCGYQYVECYTYDIYVNHFTEFIIDNIAPVVTVDGKREVAEGEAIILNVTVDSAITRLIIDIDGRQYDIPVSSVIESRCTYEFKAGQLLFGKNKIKIYASDLAGNIGLAETSINYMKKSKSALSPFNILEIQLPLRNDINGDQRIEYDYKDGDLVNVVDEGKIFSMTDDAQLEIVGLAWYWWFMIISAAGLIIWWIVEASSDNHEHRRRW